MMRRRKASAHQRRVLELLALGYQLSYDRSGIWLARPAGWKYDGRTVPLRPFPVVADRTLEACRMRGWADSEGRPPRWQLTEVGRAVLAHPGDTTLLPHEATPAETWGLTPST